LAHVVAAGAGGAAGFCAPGAGAVCAQPAPEAATVNDIATAHATDKRILSSI